MERNTVRTRERGVFGKRRMVVVLVKEGGEEREDVGECKRRRF